MKVREVYCKRWFLNKNINAITLYPFIFYNGLNPSTRLRNHEWHHIWQIKQYGVLKFYVVYLWYSVKYGYKNNPFEVDATDHE
jgi:hypothetical protein